MFIFNKNTLKMELLKLNKLKDPLDILLFDKVCLSLIYLKDNIAYKGINSSKSWCCDFYKEGLSQ